MYCRLYGETKVDMANRVEKSEARLIKYAYYLILHDVLPSFCRRCRDILAEFTEELDVVNKVPIIIQILKSLLQLEEKQVSSYL